MGKASLLCGQRDGARFMQVHLHPRDPVIAAGFSDGIVSILRLNDDGEMDRSSSDGAAVVALEWNRAGTLLGWAQEGGRIGVLDAKARARRVLASECAGLMTNSAGRIGATNGTVDVRVAPTDEEMIIARHVLSITAN